MVQQKQVYVLAILLKGFVNADTLCPWLRWNCSKNDKLQTKNLSVILQSKQAVFKVWAFHLYRHFKTSKANCTKTIFCFLTETTANWPSIIKNTRGNTAQLHLNGHTLSYNHLVHHNKQYHMKVLLRFCHLNSHTLGFHPQTKKLEPPCTA